MHGFLLAIALAATPTPAPPPSPASNDEARRAFREGADAYQAGNFEAALKDFMLSYQLSQRGELLFDIAQGYRALSRWASAKEYYERYVAEVPHGQSRERAFQELAEVKQKLAQEEAARPVVPPPGATLRFQPVQPPPVAPGLALEAPDRHSHPRPAAIVLGSVGIAAGALAVVGLVEAVGFKGWKSQAPGSVLPVSDVQSRVNSANTWATVSLISAIGAAAGLTAGALTW